MTKVRLITAGAKLSNNTKIPMTEHASFISTTAAQSLLVGWIQFRQARRRGGISGAVA